MQLWTSILCMYSQWIVQELVLEPMFSDIFSNNIQENTNSLSTKFDLKQGLKEHQVDKSF